MLGLFDIAKVADEIAQKEPIFRRSELSFAEGPFQLRDGTLIISGDGNPGCVVKGRGNVVIMGSFVGREDKPAHIDVDGDVVVMGTVSQATIDASRVYVGGGIMDVQLNARLGIEVGGDLGRALVRVGEYDLERKEIDQLRKPLSEAKGNGDAIERRLRMEEKRLYKMFKNTRVNLAPNIGRIVMSQGKNVVIDLQPIYESLSNRSEEDVDKALEEFFAKAIVGMLTRVNVHFLSGKSPHRQVVFKGIVRDMHELLLLTRQFDKQVQNYQVLEESVNEAIACLNGRIAGIYVQGQCLPDLTISATVPEVTVSDDGKMLVKGDMARLQLAPSEEGGIGVKCMNTSGLETEQILDEGQFQNCQFSVCEGEMVWQALNVCDRVEV